MHGHGYAPPPQRPSSAQLAWLRVLFVTLALMSCGFLAWVPLLRLAIVTRTVRDWLVFVGSAVLVIGALVLIGDEPTDDLDTGQEALGFTVLLGCLAAAIAYYLVMEIRHFAKRPSTPFVPNQGLHTQGPQGQAPHAQGPLAQSPNAGYGYPGGPAQQPTRPTGMPQSGPQAGTPQRPAPARIDQVRAELDELSSLLRQDGTRPAGERDGRAEGEPR